MVSYRITPGPCDRLTDIAGLSVGQAHDPDMITGTTVILPDRPIAMGVDVRGGGPGTRDTEALDPSCLVERVHGLVLSGGSVFGLSAADAVTQWLSDRGVGLDISPRKVPVVPSAILFDLANGGHKGWTRSPYPDLARDACESADRVFDQGRAGAGYGARAGDRWGGIGSASAVGPHDLQVGVIVAVNSFGKVSGEATGRATDLSRIQFPKVGIAAGNTTIAAVATNLDLDKAGCRRMAIMAQDGLARAIRPLHTPFDGDTVFAMATGSHPVEGPLSSALALAGTMAADCLVRAVTKAVSD